MKRRDLLKGLAFVPFLLHPVAGKLRPGPGAKIIKPKRLAAGGTVGVIAPSSGVSEEAFERGLQNLTDLGFKTKEGRFARGGKGFLSGTDEERLNDLHRAFSDPEVDAVWCMRGGYGASRLLPQVDYELIKKNPKIFIGFSDVTALHLAIFQKTGLVTFHGPVGTSNFTDYTKTHVLDTLMRPTDRYEIKLPPVPEGQDPELYRPKVITHGKCRGQLIGGNLSLIAALTGTPYGLKDVRGKILFIEDVNEQPYRVDRILTQLRQSMDMRSLAGIAIGVFTRSESDVPSQTLAEVFSERLGSLGIPVISGLSFGHIRDQFTLPVGIRAELNTENATMTFLESGVV